MYKLILNNKDNEAIYITGFNRMIDPVQTSEPYFSFDIQLAENNNLNAIDYLGQYLSNNITDLKVIDEDENKTLIEYYDKRIKFNSFFETYQLNSKRGNANFYIYI